MKILKSINNNIVSAYDQNGQEIVVMGRGIGYKAKDGAEIPQAMIEKIFRMDSQNATDKLKELLANLPLEHIQVSNDIIAYAKKMLGKRLNQNIYLTLTDHINFAVLRLQQGMLFQNALLLEVRRFYHEEYLIGEYALNLIEKELGVRLPADEAASVALHIVNAEYDTSIGEAVKTTNLIQAVLQVAKDSLNTRFDEQSLYYERFVTHLKFLAQRIFKSEPLTRDDPQFNAAIAQMYPKEFQCAQEISAMILEQYQHTVSNEERSYLTLHLKRIQP